VGDRQRRAPLRPPVCDACGEAAETFPLPVALEGDALTAYLGVCEACGDQLDALTR
jgi:hypothetical protein